MAMDKNIDLALTSSVLLLVLLWNTEALPTAMNAGLSKNTQLETATPSSRSSNCSLLSVDLDSIELDSKIHSGYPLVEIELRILNYSADFLKQRLTGFFQPNYWVRSQGQTGISLLVWKHSIWNLIEPYYKIGMEHITVKLTDFPQGCLRSLNAENTALVIRELLLNDFKIEKENSEGVQNTDVQVCNEIVKKTEKSAMFVYHCCEKRINGDVICDEAKANKWLEIIIRLQIAISIIVLYFCGPAFLAYFLDFAIPATRLCKISTNDPRTVRGNDQKACRAQLIMTSQRLLTQNEVPVGMFRVMYNLFTCRCRHVQVFEGNEKEGHYCDHPCTERCNIKLYEVMQLFTKAFILFILSVPLIIMTVNFYKDKVQFEEKEKIVKEMNSTVEIQTELDFFIINAFCFGPFYLFYLADMLFFGCVWKCVRPAFKKIFQLHRDEISASVMSKIREALRCPFILPCWCLWYLPIVCIIIIVAIFMYMCKLISRVLQNLKSSGWMCGLFVPLILTSLYYVFGIWAFFIVYLFFYTIIGIIIYAEWTMKILTGVVFLLIYGRTTFNKVLQDYLEYHSRVFEKLIKTAKIQSEESPLNRQRSQQRSGATPTSRQENIQVEETATPEEEEPTGFILPLTNLTIEPISRKGEAMLHIKGMFLVVDKHDQYFMPEEFFYQAIKIKSCLSPGPVDSRYFAAFISYMKIIIFLAIVFIAVMAFGDTYKVSLTYELLATVAAGFIPHIYNMIKSDNTTVKQNDEDFEEKLRAKFDEYEEDFPIPDFVSIRLGEVLEQSLGAETNADDILININTTQSQENPNRVPGTNEWEPLVQSDHLSFV